MSESSSAFLRRVRRWAVSFAGLLFPRRCCVCSCRLTEGADLLCAKCVVGMPLTGLKGRKGNFVERMLWTESVCPERASSFMYYRHRSPYSRIFFLFKYYRRPDVAVTFGEMMAHDLADTGFFDGVGCIVPVPLSARRLRKRGYNQSEQLALGVQRVTGIPVDAEAVARVVDNPTQTRFTHEERRDNVKGIFRLAHPERLRGKHVLLVDDVITTGSTLRALADEVLTAGGDVRVSVLSLGVTDNNRHSSFPHAVRP